jgi:hypothetical protein
MCRRGAGAGVQRREWCTRSGSWLLLCIVAVGPVVVLVAGATHLAPLGADARALRPRYGRLHRVRYEYGEENAAGHWLQDSSARATWRVAWRAAQRPRCANAYFAWLGRDLNTYPRPSLPIRRDPCRRRLRGHIGRDLRRVFAALCENTPCGSTGDALRCRARFGREHSSRKPSGAALEGGGQGLFRAQATRESRQGRRPRAAFRLHASARSRPPRLSAIAGRPAGSSAALTPGRDNVRLAG